MNSVPKLFSCCYADCWTENHFSTEFGVLTPNHTHSHTLFWGCVSRWFGRALAWHARGQRFDPAILHQKSTVLRRKYGAFLLCVRAIRRSCQILFCCFVGFLLALAFVQHHGDANSTSNGSIQSNHLTLSSDDVIMLSVPKQKELMKWSLPRYLPVF